LNAAPPGGGVPTRETLRPAVETAAQAWAELESRWRDLTLPRDRLDPTLARAAGEVRAAYLELSHQGNGPSTVPINVTRPGLVEGTQASLQALKASADLAYVVNEKANDPHLTGPARALSARAHNDAERAREAHARSPRNRDVLWITPRDIYAHKLVPLPRPVADGLRAAAWDTAQAAGSLSAALAPSALLVDGEADGVPPGAERPSITVEMNNDRSSGRPL
jgi:hypothetical protein